MGPQLGCCKIIWLKTIMFIKADWTDSIEVAIEPVYVHWN